LSSVVVVQGSGAGQLELWVTELLKTKFFVILLNKATFVTFICALIDFKPNKHTYYSYSIAAIFSTYLYIFSFLENDILGSNYRFEIVTFWMILSVQ